MNVKGILFGMIIVSSLLYGCASFNQLISVCEETPSTEHLLPIRNVLIDSIHSKTLSTANSHWIEHCNDHFAYGSDARKELLQAVEAINMVEDVSITFGIIAGNHRNEDDLIDPARSVFGYCDPDSPSADCSNNGEWSMQWFGHTPSQVDPYDHFTIFINSNSYGHSQNPMNASYPHVTGILHELGHALGMRHTRRRNRGHWIWHANDQAYISMMQGTLRYPSALDVFYLRSIYGAGTSEHRNYVAGTLTRIPNDNGGYQKKSFYNGNPRALYIDSDNELKDCSTHEAPVFYVSWFNTGTISSETDLCGVNRIYLRKRSDRFSSRGITLKQWKIAPMPNMSQDQMISAVSLTERNIERINLNDSYDLVYHVNALGTLNEIRSDDNEVSYPIGIYDDSSGCFSIQRYDGVPEVID